MPISIKDIADIVTKSRKQQGLTQKQLAGLANTGTRFVVELEAGKPSCEIGKVLHVLHQLDIQVKLEYESK